MIMNKKNGFRFRKSMATPSDSLATVVELSTLEDLAKHLNTVFGLRPITAADLEIFPCHTDRHGWQNHMVSVKNRFIAGFTDRPVGKLR
jgi:hypothetical protein